MSNKTQGTPVNESFTPGNRTKATDSRSITSSSTTGNLPIGSFNPIIIPKTTNSSQGTKK